jgi:hypothetical protein
MSISLGPTRRSPIAKRAPLILPKSLKKSCAHTKSAHNLRHACELHDQGWRHHRLGIRVDSRDEEKENTNRGGK